MILSVETATRAGSWALLEDGIVVAEGQGDPATPHDLSLPEPLMQMLARAERTLHGVDYFAVATGPGSFTGLRVGIATIQGLAMATGKRVIPIPTLDAIAEAAAAEPGAASLDYIAVWLDGQRGEIFASLYAMRENARLLMPPQAAPPAAIAAEIADLVGVGHVGFAGDGAHRYHGAFETMGIGDARLLPVRPIAPHLARLAARRTDTAVSPRAVVPVYVRRPDAELARRRIRP